RDYKVTGVQTCALPILLLSCLRAGEISNFCFRAWSKPAFKHDSNTANLIRVNRGSKVRMKRKVAQNTVPVEGEPVLSFHKVRLRSEERRVGKERKDGVW